MYKGFLLEDTISFQTGFCLQINWLICDSVLHWINIATQISFGKIMHKLKHEM